MLTFNVICEYDELFYELSEVCMWHFYVAKHVID